LSFRYRKKPVVIEAFQLTAENRASNEHWPSWANEAWQKGPHEIGALVAVAGAQRIEVVTLEGQLNASIGDWIIRGVKGELYPCKPDIFAATYEAA
jgi:hypothetical protein